MHVCFSLVFFFSSNFTRLSAFQVVLVILTASRTRTSMKLAHCQHVGMTVRQLHAWALEHLRAANQRQEHMAFGDHYKTGHKEKDKPKLSFKIISQNHDYLRLHIEEALAIRTLKPE